MQSLHNNLNSTGIQTNAISSILFRGHFYHCPLRLSRCGVLRPSVLQCNCSSWSLWVGIWWGYDDNCVYYTYGYASWSGIGGHVPGGKTSCRKSLVRGFSTARYRLILSNRRFWRLALQALERERREILGSVLITDIETMAYARTFLSLNLCYIRSTGSTVVTQ
jgi:hypothetical protein